MKSDPESLIREVRSLHTTIQHTPNEDQRTDHMADMDTYSLMAISQLMLEIRDMLFERLPDGDVTAELARTQAPDTVGRVNEAEDAIVVLVGTSYGTIRVEKEVANVLRADGWELGFDSSQQWMMNRTEPPEKIPSNPYKRS